MTTRFAPSPTGYLHIGGLRTALFNYLYARKNNGRFLLRIEDTDLARNSHDAAKAIVESFQWVDLEHNGEIVYQSERFALYARYVKQLLEEGKAYYCYMSKEELEVLRAQAEAQGKKWKYDNRYRDFTGTPPEGIAPVVRIKAPLQGVISFEDGVKGRISVDASEIDDFVIARSDGSPTYNFVVAIDDALMGVSDVIRGDDHLSNTPKQIVVYQALDFEVPKFFHVPMILNPQGKKLSKRDGAMGVMEYKKLGYLPEALLNFLVRLGWSYGDEEIFSMERLLEVFDPYKLNSSPSSYNEEKLLWLNHHYIKQTPAHKLESLLIDFGAQPLQSFACVSECDEEKRESVREALFNALKERSKTLIEFANNFNEVLNAPKEYDSKLLNKLDSQGVEFLRALSETLKNVKFQSEQECEEFLHTFCESKHLKLGQCIPLVRLALLGKGGGIGVPCALFVLGNRETCVRIESLLAKNLRK
ncbi:glutamate--tRNA ligase [Helicobacter himalayensis]|uniref:glutamate--tRNA ligase n=1 Tax=Helicobacter himalayensis TaxID=1591088 RepID=UPI003D6E6E00